MAITTFKLVNMLNPVGAYANPFQLRWKGERGKSLLKKTKSLGLGKFGVGRIILKDIMESPQTASGEVPKYKDVGMSEKCSLS